MDTVIKIIVGALHITLLDLVLAGDNIGVIALATKSLSADLAKRASIIGIVAAMGFRILFASIVTYIMMIEWLPIKLIGGLLLVKITWEFIKPEKVSEDSSDEDAVKVQNKFWPAVMSIIIADMTMSLDNVLAIGAAAHGNVGLIVFGLILNIPIIFLGSQFVANLMKKHAIVIYIGGAILAHTAFAMIFEDQLIASHIPHVLDVAIPYVLAGMTFVYGLFITRKIITAPAMAETAVSEK